MDPASHGSASHDPTSHATDLDAHDPHAASWRANSMHNSSMLPYIPHPIVLDSTKNSQVL